MAWRETVSSGKTIALGIGCDRKADERELKKLVRDVMKANGISAADIMCIATIESKKHEPAIHALSRELGASLRLFTAEALNREAPRISDPSELARSAVGTPSVAEAAALAAAGTEATLIAVKQKSAHCTAALAGRLATSRQSKGQRP
jgi:cobalt-precorrin 5A hydrolase/precorrin-3B C17-methyltransferase